MVNICYSLSALHKCKRKSAEEGGLHYAFSFILRVVSKTLSNIIISVILECVSLVISSIVLINNNSKCFYLFVIRKLVKVNEYVPIERSYVNMTVAELIKKTRTDHNMTQEDYGQKFGVTRQTVSSWENGVSHS